MTVFERLRSNLRRVLGAGPTTAARPRAGGTGLEGEVCFCPRRRKLLTLVLAGMLVPGCTGSDKRLSYIGQDELDHCPQEYLDEALTIDEPDVETCTHDNVLLARNPRKLGDRTRDEIWDLTLTEAIHLALTNNRVIRTRADFRTAGSQVFANPDNVGSVYDPAIRDTGVLFGVRGVEGALAAFDPTFSTSMVWGHNEQIQNNVFLGGGVAGGTVLSSDIGQFQSSLSKTFAYGATASLAHNWNYQWSNAGFQLFPSVYTGNVALNYVQPLWAGAGTEFTRIAGPFNTGLQGITGVSQGVTIARINTDISLVDFEIQVRTMLKDVEDTYWDLYLAYRAYDSAIEARDSFLESWRFAAKNRGVGRFSDLDEQQTREAYYAGRGAAETALQDIYNLETQLRRLCGLPNNDGRIIRPADNPTTGEFIPDWNICLAEALTNREEIRKQKWNLKSLELQVRAAKSLTHPQLNFVSSYQLNGFGNDLFGPNGPAGTPGAELQSAYRTLFKGQQTGWTAGLQFSMPLGFRSAETQLRNMELRATKAREVLALQEVELTHELTKSFQDIAWRYQAAQTAFNRWQTAEAQIEGRESRYQTGVPGVETSVLLDQYLQVRRRAAEAEVAFYTTVVEYNKAITDLHSRKGTLLAMNNVYLAEGPWTPAAYKDAMRRAWARTFAFDPPELDPVEQQPENVALDEPYGPLEQIQEPANPGGASPAPSAPPAPNLAPHDNEEEEAIPPPPTASLKSRHGPLSMHRRQEGLSLPRDAAASR
jgi:outer membrane protein TolC